jgi:peptidoglycan/xylan/chitin deacetylase (PgdA/CDA1 family)
MSPHVLAHLTGKVLILGYHRVIPRTELETTFVQPGMYVTPKTFDRHLRFLTAHFELLSFRDLLALWDEDAWDRTKRYCAITFDDGWLDNYLHAYPLLRAHRAPATIFLPTGLIGTDEWLWPDRLAYHLHRHRSQGSAAMLSEPLASLVRRYPALAGVNGRGGPDAFDSLIELAKTLSEQERDEVLHRLGEAFGVPVPAGRRLLNWDEAREMSRHGIAFGSHTSTHAILTQVTRTALQRELLRPLEVLRQQRVNQVSVLSYPNGDHTEAALVEARSAGYRAAVTIDPGLESSRPADLFRLKRIVVHDDVSWSVPLLALHIARQSRGTTGVARGRNGKPGN